MDQITDLTKHLDPSLTDAFEKRPVVDWDDFESFDELRARMPVTPLESTDEVNIENLEIPGYESGGYTPTIRVYKPASGTSEDTLIWIHGGGFVVGSVYDNDAMCVQLVKHVRCNVVSVDWRLAPEHPFPAGQNDCYAALLWVADNPQHLGPQQKKIVIGGGSAGGCLAASLALMARDLDGPVINHQILVIPVLDDRMQTRSAQTINDPRVWSRDKAIKAWQLYLGENHDGEVSPYAAPARATDLSRLPPASIFVEEMDLLRDEAVEYANHLTAADVRTSLTLYAGTSHGHMGLNPQAEISRRTNRDVQEAIKVAFGRRIFD